MKRRRTIPGAKTGETKQIGAMDKRRSGGGTYGDGRNESIQTFLGGSSFFLFSRNIGAQDKTRLWTINFFCLFHQIVFFFIAQKD